MSAQRGGSGPAGVPIDGHAGDLVSAHLDGELDEATETWVRSHLEECEVCRTAADGAAAARAWVHAMPAVDSASLVEGVIARHRSVVRLGAGFVGVAAVVLGALALSSAVIRVELVPDVERLVIAHGDGPAAGDSVAHLAARGLGSIEGVRPVESIGRPYSAPPAMIGNRASLSRRAIFDGRDLVAVSYGDGASTVSVFEQPGRLRWDLLPAGHLEQLGRRQVWVLDRSGDDPTVLVTEAGHLVVTVVSDDRAAALTVIDGLPDIERESTWERIHDACSRLTEAFAVGG